MTPGDLIEEFEKVRPQLRSYIFRITASMEDTDDLLQDTYMKAAEHINTFRGESSLKTWIFTISSNLAKDNLRAKKRWTENVTDICREKALENPNYFPEIKHLQATSPQTQFEVKEHITFCLTCISKSLPLEQQISIFLREIYAFTVLEISQIIGSSESMVKYYLHTARTKMVQIFDGRCALINKKGVCHQCSELNGIFNPNQNIQHELMKIEMVKIAEVGDKGHLLDLRLQIVRETDAFQSSGAILQIHHLEHNRKIMETL